MTHIIKRSKSKTRKRTLTLPKTPTHFHSHERVIGDCVIDDVIPLVVQSEGERAITSKENKNVLFLTSFQHFLSTKYQRSSIVCLLDVSRLYHSALQSQQGVSAYFTSKQILPFGFAEQLSYNDAWRGCGLEEKQYPANTTSSNNAVLMLAQRLRRWPNIQTELFQRAVFAWQSCICHNQSTSSGENHAA